MIPVPYEIQRRAWECALMLRSEFNDRLTLEQNIRAEVALHTGPDRLGWSECGDMLCLWRGAVATRV